LCNPGYSDRRCKFNTPAGKKVKEFLLIDPVQRRHNKLEEQFSVWVTRDRNKKSERQQTCSSGCIRDLDGGRVHLSIRENAEGSL
jgi:hypothetical protein